MARSPNGRFPFGASRGNLASGGGPYQAAYGAAHRGLCKRLDRTRGFIVGEFVLRRSVLIAVVVAVVCNVGIASASALSVSTTPANYPAFSSSVSDYVVPSCPSTGGVPVNVTTDPGQSVSVDGQTAQTGTFTATANVTTGQEFTIVESNGGTTTGTWYMRCLPSDFPGFTSSVTGTPQAQFYLTDINKPGATNGYATFFDDNGVPVWWYPVKPGGYASTTRVGSTGVVAWTSQAPGGNTYGNPVPVINLGGQSIGTVSSPDGPIDLHEFQVLPNGAALVIVDEKKCCTDLSSWGSGFPTNATVQDPVIEEIALGNKVVWRWDALAHINPIVETAPQWYSSTPTSSGAYDVFHMNSLSYSNGVILMSFRHLDAIYAITTSNGNIWMKIGGHTDTGLSYTVLNDPVFTGGGTFCGQHDARIVATNLISVHDNGSNCGRAPRAVAYSLNPTAKTATFVTSVTDSRAPSSFCCGSARVLPGGDWVADWGSNPFFTEVTSTGTPVYTVNWTDPGAFAYRAIPIMPGTYTSAQLRAGMNTMFPHAARTN